MGASTRAGRGRVQEEAWNSLCLVSLVKGNVPTHLSLRQLAVGV